VLSITTGGSESEQVYAGFYGNLSAQVTLSTLGGRPPPPPPPPPAPPPPPPPARAPTHTHLRPPHCPHTEKSGPTVAGSVYQNLPR